MNPKQFFYLDRENDVVDIDSIVVSFGRRWDGLRESIATLGILSPLLVRRKGDVWQILSGTGRWLCSSERRVPAIEIPCSDREALLIHLHENRDRGFNPAEIARMVLRLQATGLTLEEISKGYASLLGVPPGVKILLDHLSLLRLSPLLLTRLAEGALNLKNALILSAFPPEEADFLMTLSDRMSWNANKQREAFSLLWEICRRDGISAMDFLNRKECKDLWDVEKSALSSDAFRQKLQAVKNPQWEAAQSAFQQALEDAKSPYPLSITPTAYFEKPDIHFEFHCKNTENFRKALSALQVLQEKDVVRKLFSITGEKK